MEESWFHSLGISGVVDFLGGLVWNFLALWLGSEIRVVVEIQIFCEG